VVGDIRNAKKREENGVSVVPKKARQKTNYGIGKILDMRTVMK
jgi:hypothetical protein